MLMPRFIQYDILTGLSLSVASKEVPKENLPEGRGQLYVRHFFPMANKRIDHDRQVVVDTVTGETFDDEKGEFQPDKETKD